MFYSITGKIVNIGVSSLAVDCSGVAFQCSTSRTSIMQSGGMGETVTLYTYLSVREDALELFGFCTTAELDFFKLLTGVSGVGPKAGLAILSLMSPDKLALAIVSGDVKAITAAPGVGGKLASRIVLELKDKVAKGGFSGQVSPDVAGAGRAFAGENTGVAIDALVSLGYSQSDAAHVIAGLDPTLSVEELIKQALRAIGGRN